MKKFVLLIVSFISTTMSLHSQEAYISMYLNNHFPLTYYTPPDYISPLNKINYYPTYYNISLTHNFSISNGKSYGVNLTYITNKQIGMEIEIAKFDSKAKSEVVKNDLYGYYNYHITYNWKFQTTNFKPKLVLKIPLKKINLLTKAGIIIGLSELEIVTSPDYNTTHKNKYKFYKNNSTGYLINLEISFNLNNRIGLSFLSGIENQFYTPRKMKWIESNNTDLNNLDTVYLESEYKDEIIDEPLYDYGYSSIFFTDFNKPQPKLAKKLVLNSYYIGFSINYKLFTND